MDVLVYMVAAYLGFMLVGHRLSTRKSGYSLMQTLFFAFAEKE